VWSFTTAGIAPTVVTTDPASDATDVAVNSTVKASFSEAMDQSTVTSATFSVKAGSTPVAGAITWNANQVIFTPTASLDENTVYTVTISTGAKDLSDVAIGNAKSWNFTTGDFTAPNVDSMTPSANGVAVTGVVTINFTEPVDTTGILDGDFTLSMAGADVTTITGLTSSNATSITYTIDGGIVANALYHASLNTSIVDIAGNNQSIDIQWDFTTDSLIVASGSESGGEVLSSQGIDNSVEHYYVVTGLSANKRYAINLDATTNGDDLNLLTYTGAFTSLNCESKQSATGDELCTSISNSDGEIYVQVNNQSGSASSFNLTLATVTTTGGSVNNTYDYTTISGLTANTEYKVILGGFSPQDLDLYVFEDGGVIKSLCRSKTTSNESCIFTTGVASSSVKVLVAGVGQVANYTLGAVLTADSFKSSTPLLVGEVYNHVFTGLSAASTYTVNLITTSTTDDIIDDDFDLVVDSDASGTLICSSITLGTGVESCITSGGDTSLFVTIDATNSALESNFIISYTIN